MKYLLAFLLGAFTTLTTQAQTRLFNGMYLQWGYNREWYSHSNIHFKMSNGNDFTVYNAKAEDKNDFAAIIQSPIDVSIPQYNIRIGFYLNQQHSRMIEVNFDHSKYIVIDGQSVQVKGRIDGKEVNDSRTIDPLTFLHFEHTDGANWLHLNYANQHPIRQNKSRTLLSYVWKVGAGINIPRTDFTWRGDEFNNQFHIAGYNASVEAGLRYYPLKKLFLEATAKTGYVNYLNALANTTALKGNSASHSFEYFEAIMTVGYDIGF